MLAFEQQIKVYVKNWILSFSFLLIMTNANAGNPKSHIKDICVRKILLLPYSSLTLNGTLVHQHCYPQWKNHLNNFFKCKIKHLISVYHVVWKRQCRIVLTAYTDNSDRQSRISPLLNASQQMDASSHARSALSAVFLCLAFQSTVIQIIENITRCMKIIKCEKYQTDEGVAHSV